MNQVSHASKYDDWKDEYSWSTCRTNREEYGKFLLSVLTSEKNGFVLNLNGSWGSGKTQFLRRLYVELAEQQYPVVYIDAWESDFIKDPLIVVCTEILNQLGYIFKNVNKGNESEIVNDRFNTAFFELQGSFGKFLSFSKGIAKGYELYSSDNSASLFSEMLEGISISPELSMKMKGVNETNFQLLMKVQEKQNELVQAMKDIRKQVNIICGILNELYDLKIPLVILVDELDRCRPDYAIKMLEVIKHFFDVKGCAFLIATDTDSLEKSIKSIYGSEFSSQAYLKRFFNQRIRLPKTSVQNFIKARPIDFDFYQKNNLTLYPYNDPLKLEAIIPSILDRDDLELRDIEQILDKLESCLNYLVHNQMDKIEFINIVVLIYGIVEQHLNLPDFYERSNNRLMLSEPFNSLIFNIETGSFIDSQLKVVTLISSKKEYTSLNSHSKYLKNNEMLTMSSEDFANYNQEGWYETKILNENLKQLNAWKKSPENYWLWDDYQKLIGLTSHFE